MRTRRDRVTISELSRNGSAPNLVVGFEHQYVLARFCK